MTDEAVDVLMGEGTQAGKKFSSSDMYDIYVRGDPTRGKGSPVPLTTNPN